MSKNMKPIKSLLNFSIINIDKPCDPTSFLVSQFVKKILKLKKTSHLGTLDPQVSGVLPVALNRACKLNEFFMHRDKTYVGIMRLHEDVEEEVLKKQMKKFVGKITQMPPLRSRVKRAYREREVKEFKFIEKDDKNVLFKAKVEAGTYIRTLIHDLGKNIGGAHMLELRRTKASIFDEKNSVNLYDLENAVEEYKKGNEIPLRKILIPAEEAILKIMPKVELSYDNIKKLLTGKPLMEDDIEDSISKEEIFAGFCGEKFIAVYKKSNEGDIIARPLFVFN